MPTRILIVTYYWPPYTGSGVQRWLKFAKFLPQHGFEPWVLTPENPLIQLKDESLMSEVPPQVEVLHLPIWEPAHLFFKLKRWLGMISQPADLTGTQSTGWLHRLAVWMRGNLFIPDGRIFWVRPAVSLLVDIVRSQQIPVVITTGPPHSLHLVGLHLKKRLPDIKWIADFRDPWSEWDLLDTFRLTGWARRRHRMLERQVLQAADRVLTVTPFYQQRLQTLGQRSVDLITNGYDAEDFQDLPAAHTPLFTIRHLGVMDDLRDPRPFLKAVRLLASRDPRWRSQICIEFIGSINTALKTEIEADPILRQIVALRPYRPHREIPALLVSSHVLLLVLAHTHNAPGNIPGKLFEYLAAGVPIVGIGDPQGDAAVFIAQSQAGEVFRHTRPEDIAHYLNGIFERWVRGESIARPAASPYSRQALTGKLASLLSALVP